MENPTVASLKDIENKIEGRIITPADPEYDETRKIWNAMIDRRPAVIIQCKNADDVSRAVHFARENDLEMSIRGAGHNIAGNALCNNGVLVDLSTMKNIEINPEEKVAFVEPGCTLADFDAAAQEYGLATPIGINSTTGISGLTLGGGIGWLTKKYGMTIDNLLSVELVTADGSKLKASEIENHDLFWAVRGGGGNFGVITLFEFALHEVGPEIFAGLLVFPMEQAKDILAQFRKFTDNAPENLPVFTVIRHAPPLPFLQENVHGQKVVVLAFCYLGDPSKGLEYADSFRSFGNLHGEHVGIMPFVDWQKMFDPLLAPGARNYWKTHNFTELSDHFFDTLIEYVNKLPSQQCEIFVADFSGALNRVPASAMAYANRDLHYIMNVHGRWEDKKDDGKCIDWARDFFQASKPFASSGAFINFMTEEETDRIGSAYGANYQKLVEIKSKYDPDNVFRHNQNIEPVPK
jgi:hypothetical protein